jgi:hypothetical protein
MHTTITGRASGFRHHQISIICAIALLSLGSIPVRAASVSIIEVTAQALPCGGCIYFDNVLDTKGAGAGTSRDAVAGPVSPAAGGTSYGYGFADISTGELKVTAQATAANATEEAANSATGTAQIMESFTVTGSGHVQFFLALDGSYDLSRFTVGAYPGFNIQANLNVNGAISAPSDSFQYSTGQLVTPDPVSGTINEQLSILATVQPGTITLTAFLLAQISAGTHGLIDLSNTATLYVMALDGVQLTPFDDRFLSNPAYDANAVPLPAALPLFAGGLTAFGFLGWRRKKRTAKAAA